MIIKVDRQKLLKSLQIVSGSISNKSTLPVLFNILIETNQTNLKLVATDLDITTSTLAEAEIVEAGAITVPAKRFIDILKELPDEPLTISVKKDNLINIKCSKILFKIACISKDEFPKQVEHISDNKIVLKGNELKKLFTKTIFAASKDETRYALNGILFSIKDNTITTVATDSRRLVLNTKNITNKDISDIKVTISNKTIQEVNKLLINNSDIELMFTEKQIIFNIDNTSIVSNLISSEFPNYEQVIPAQHEEVLSINKEEFLTAIKRVSLLTTLDSQAIKLTITKNKAVLSKNTPNLGEVKEEISCEYSNNEFCIGFNPGYLIEGLKHITQKQLHIEFTDAKKPIVVKDDSYLYVVLPMQVV